MGSLQPNQPESCSVVNRQRRMPLRIRGFGSFALHNEADRLRDPLLSTPSRDEEQSRCSSIRFGLRALPERPGLEGRRGESGRHFGGQDAGTLVPPTPIRKVLVRFSPSEPVRRQARTRLRAGMGLPHLLHDHGGTAKRSGQCSEAGQTAETPVGVIALIACGTASTLGTCRVFA